MDQRLENDSLGSVVVPADRLWGAQTQRAIDNFRIGNATFPRSFIRALGIVKKAAAQTNAGLGILDRTRGMAIIRACDEVISGGLDAEFPLVIWQSGSGTQTNMNANEVIANRATRLLDPPAGAHAGIHPNDEVNLSQSSNDVFPTCMHVAAVEVLNSRLLPRLAALTETMRAKSAEFAAMLKIGRTHLMDAVPMTLGQEFSGYAAQLAQAGEAIRAATADLDALALGGTAVGTGFATPSGFAEAAVARIAAETGFPFRPAANRFAAIAAHDALVRVSGTLRALAVALLKIAGDIRLLASGPRCGLGELHLPGNEPGSSFMPGKINPTQCESLIMVSYQVMGNDLTISLAGAHGQLELNACKPVLIHNLLESAELLADGCASFDRHCARGIAADEVALARHLGNSLMLVTALREAIGYDLAAKVAIRADQGRITLKEAALDLKVMSAETFDRLVSPAGMLGPG